jgi:hypothetical protein
MMKNLNTKFTTGYNFCQSWTNLKTGIKSNDNRGYEEMVGQHESGETNESGEKFAELCGLNNLIIDGSIFTSSIKKKSGLKTIN